VIENERLIEGYIIVNGRLMQSVPGAERPELPRPEEYR
jgi:hypothetical protein